MGYGNAAGFLFDNNIVQDEDSYEELASSDEGENQSNLNPVTGTEDMPKEVEEMTEEEKEIEAERIMGLIKKLEDNGIVKVLRREDDLDSNKS